MPRGRTLDIAGTSYVDSKKPYQEKGSTGVAVRTLAELAVAHCRVIAAPLAVLYRPPAGGDRLGVPTLTLPHAKYAIL